MRLFERFFQVRRLPSPGPLENFDTVGRHACSSFMEEGRFHGWETAEST
jgi:hypothetical protein